MWQKDGDGKVSLGEAFDWGSRNDLIQKGYAELSKADPKLADALKRIAVLSADKSNAVKLNLSGDVTRQEYLNTSTIFGIRRDDTIWLGSAGLSWNVTPNVVVSTQYAHTTADSNIPVYGYRRNTLTAGVELSF